MFDIAVTKDLDIRPRIPNKTWVSFREKPLDIKGKTVELCSQVCVPQVNTRSYTQCYIELIDNYIICKIVVAIHSDK